MLWGIFGCHLLPIKVIWLSVLFFIFISLCDVAIYSHTRNTTAHSFSFCTLIEQIVDCAAYTLIHKANMTLCTTLWIPYQVCAVYVCVCVKPYLDAYVCIVCACTTACVEWTYEMESVSAAVQRCRQLTQPQRVSNEALFKAALLIINWISA